MNPAPAQYPQTILITGASSGIGLALAQAYAGTGRILLLTGRDSARLKTIADFCLNAGATVHTTTIPVTDAAAFSQQILLWDDAHPIDLVIANAGISGGSGDGFDAILSTNLQGTFNTVRPLIPRMTERKNGHIALMSSIAGFRGLPNAPAYSVSKVAVRAWGDALRPLLRQDGVAVSIIFPGFVKTPLTDVNAFKMPFLMTAEKAAKIILKGLAAKKSEIAFPFRMAFLARGIAALPRVVGDFILMRAPRKP